MARGGFKLDVGGRTLTVAVTTSSGAVPTCFTTSTGATTQSLPATISADTSFFFAGPEELTISVKTSAGTEIASAAGGTIPFSVRDGQFLELAPHRVQSAFASEGGGVGGTASRGLDVVTGPGGTAGANVTATLTLGDPTNVTTGYDLYAGTLNANATITLPTPVAGARFTLRLAQDATGGRTVSFTGATSYPAGAVQWLTVANAINELFVTCPDGVTWEIFPLTGLGPLVPTASKTSAYTAVAGDFVMVDATGGAFAVAPPTASAGAMFAVKKTDASANAITVTGLTEVLSKQGQAQVFVSDGTTWVRLIREGVTDIAASGTPSSTTYLRGDGSWATPAGGGSAWHDASGSYARSFDVGVLVNTNFTPAAGVLHLTKLVSPQALTVNNIPFCLATAGVTVANAYIGVYDVATGNLLGTSADISTTLQGSTGYITVPLSSGVSLAADQAVWVALLIGSAGTMPITIKASAVVSITPINAHLTASTARSATQGSGLTALPGSITPASNSLSANLLYAGIA